MCIRRKSIRILLIVSRPSSSLGDRGGRCHGPRLDLCSFPMPLDCPRNLRTRRGLRYRPGRVIIRGPRSRLSLEMTGEPSYSYIRYDTAVITVVGMWRPFRWLMVVVGELLE